MYGLITKFRAVPTKRDELVSILISGSAGMAGCQSCIVARDPSDDDAVWITEVWDSQESHQASMSIPSVQSAMKEGKPLIAKICEHIETLPVGGQGIF